MKSVHLLVISFFLLLQSTSAMALDATVVDGMIQTFSDASKAWEAPLLKIAIDLFWMLATIQFAWAMIGLAFKGADFNAWISTIVTQIMFIGFMSWLLTKFSWIAGSIIETFRKAAGQASGQNFFSPSDFFIKAWKLVGDIYDKTSLLEPGNSLGLIIAGIIIMICFALICAFMVVALVEMYIVISASVLLMGFGGSQWTKDYAIRAVQYAVSVGAKLFVLQLIAGLGVDLMDGWIASTDTKSLEHIVGMIGCSVILLALTKMIPEIIQGIINGTSIGNGGALTSAMSAVAGGAMGAAVATAGQSAAVGSSFKLASEQLKTAQATGTGPSSAMGKAGFMAGNMAMNMSSALKSDLGSRLSGSTTGGRMAGSMMNKANELRSKRSKSNQDENTIS